MQFDKAVYKWFKQARATGVNFGGTVLNEKALKTADKLGIDDFSVLTGWIDRFKKSHRTCYRTVNREAASVGVATVVDSWKQSVELQRVMSPGTCSMPKKRASFLRCSH